MNPMPTEEFEVQITDEQVQFFRENGYLQLDRVTTDAEIEWLRELYDQIFVRKEGIYFDLAGKMGHKGRDDLPQVITPEKSYPDLLETVYVRNTRRIARRLLNVEEDFDLRPFGHMILKPAGHGADTPWHQDEAYWPTGFRYEGLSVWMPLDDATVENGCMQFVPGTHNYRVVEHRHINDDPTVQGLMTEQVDPAGAVACPIPAGAATAHHCRILHYTGPNRTDRQRRAYIQSFTAPMEKIEGEAPRPWLEAQKEALAGDDSDAAKLFRTAVGKSR